MNLPRSRLLEELILKSWWTLLFFFLLFFSYDRASHKREREESHLRNKLCEIRCEKKQALERQQELQLKIASQDSPSGIELILMKELGLVPEGQKKVLFSENAQP